MNPADHDKALEALRQDGAALGYWTKTLGFQTVGMVTAAINENGRALGAVAPPFVTSELCREACFNNPAALRYVPEEKLTDDFIDELMFNRPSVTLLALNEINPSYLTLRRLEYWKATEPDLYYLHYQNTNTKETNDATT